MIPFICPTCGHVDIDTATCTACVDTGSRSSDPAQR